MAEEETEEVPVRNEVPQGEIISLSDKRWENFVIEVGDLLEVKFTSAEASVEAASVAFLVTKVGRLGLVEGRYIGSTNEALGKLCVNSINRKGLPIHICEEAPCPYAGADVAGHVKSLTWWRPGEFKGDYITSWGKAVLKEYVEFGTIKKRGKEKGDEDPDEEEPEKETTKKTPKDPKPKKGLKPPLKRPAASGTKRAKPGREEKDRGGLEKLRNRLAGLRQRLQRRPEQDEQEIIDVEAWSELQEEAGNTESAEEQLALTLDTGGRLDPFTSKLALAPAVKQRGYKRWYIEREEGEETESEGQERQREKRPGQSAAGSSRDAAEEKIRRKAKEGEEAQELRIKKGKGIGGADWWRKEEEKKEEGRQSRSVQQRFNLQRPVGRGEHKLRIRDAGAFAEKSLKKPGTVLRMLARQTLDQSSVIDVGDAHEVTGGVKMAKRTST